MVQICIILLIFAGDLTWRHIDDYGPLEGFYEADVMSQWLQNRGISSDTIICEKQSMSTIENAVFTEKIIRNLSFKSMTLITSASHIGRAEQVFLNILSKNHIFTSFSAENIINENRDQFY